MHTLYRFDARNPKELSVFAGEELLVLDNARRWWHVRNSYGDEGFVPNTCLVDDRGLAVDCAVDLPIIKHGRIEAHGYKYSRQGEAQLSRLNSSVNVTNVQPPPMHTVNSMIIPVGQHVQPNVSNVTVDSVPTTGPLPPPPPPPPGPPPLPSMPPKNEQNSNSGEDDTRSGAGASNLAAELLAGRAKLKKGNEKNSKDQRKSLSTIVGRDEDEGVGYHKQTKSN